MRLQEFFEENPKAALAFSGGTDSSFLLYEGLKHGCDIKPYFVKTQFQPQFELNDALKLAKELNIPLTVLTPDILAHTEVAENTAERCYFCKRHIFNAIQQAAQSDGYTLILDGTNASDDVTDRPGMKALKEMQVRSPLQECGITKAQVRELSEENGLFTWNKPSYACLATRVPTGTMIMADTLEKVEKAENFMAEQGFSDFRVRTMGQAAKIQLPEAQLDRALSLRQTIIDGILPYFSDVLLDLKPR